ncbi:MAG TPA: aldehyde dehydrogenase family protein, partial [Isosphaeraceae bacterium]
MAIAASDVLIARNPATGAELGRVPATPPEAVAEAVARARGAQEGWGETSWRHRQRVLRRWWAALTRRSDDLAEGLRREIGKPAIEALGEVVSTLDGVRWTVLRAGRALADERIGPGWQRWMLMPAARLRWRPFGVVGMIGTWNYPLFLNVPTIAAALAAGNAVVWKPSEWGVLTGRALEESLEEAEVPAGLVATVYGGA